MVARRSTGTATAGPAASVEADVQMPLRRLKTHGGRAGLANMALYAIPSERALGVAVRDIQILAKKLGRRQDLAAALWRTGWYEARMLAA